MSREEYVWQPARSGPPPLPVEPIRRSRGSPVVVALLSLLTIAGWLLAIVLTVPPETPIAWLPLGLFVVMQALRLWVIATLGPYWTTRIVSLPDISAYAQLSGSMTSFLYAARRASKSNHRCTLDRRGRSIGSAIHRHTPQPSAMSPIVKALPARYSCVAR